MDFIQRNVDKFKYDYRNSTANAYRSKGYWRFLFCVYFSIIFAAVSGVLWVTHKILLSVMEWNGGYTVAYVIIAVVVSFLHARRLIQNDPDKKV